MHKLQSVLHAFIYFVIVLFLSLSLIVCNKKDSNSINTISFDDVSVSQQSRLTLRFAQGLTDITYFNPHEAQTPIELQLAHLLYPTLIVKNPYNGKTEAGLAKSWKIKRNIQTNNTQYTFTLKKAFWSDNTPITAMQVKESLLEIISNKYFAAPLLAFTIKNGNNYFSNSSLKSQLAITVLDDFNLEITTSFTKAPLLEILSHPAFAILPFANGTVDTQIFNLNSNKIHGGIYAIDSIDEKQIKLKLRKKSNFGKKSLAKNITLLVDQQYYNNLFLSNKDENKKQTHNTDALSFYSHFLLSAHVPNFDSLSQQLDLASYTSSVFTFNQNAPAYVSTTNNEVVLHGFLKMLIYFTLEKSKDSFNSNFYKYIQQAHSLYPNTVSSPYTEMKQDSFQRSKGYAINNTPTLDEVETYEQMLKRLNNVNIFIATNKKYSYMYSYWNTFLTAQITSYLKSKNIKVNFTSSKDNADIMLSIMSPIQDSIEGMLCNILHIYEPSSNVNMKGAFNDGFSNNNYYLELDRLNIFLQRQAKIIPLYYLPFVDVNTQKSEVYTTRLFEQALYWRPLILW